MSYETMSYGSFGQNRMSASPQTLSLKLCYFSIVFLEGSPFFISLLLYCIYCLFIAFIA